MPLHPMAVEAVRDILAHVPQELTADFFVKFHEDINQLHELSKRERRRQEAQEVVNTLDLPLKVGDVLLFRLSVGANEWLNQYPYTWWGEDSPKPDLRMIELATVYAMAHREKEPYLNLVTPFDAKLKILTWAKKTKVAESALMLAATYLFPEFDWVAREIMGVNTDDDAEFSPIAIDSIAQIVSKEMGISTFSAIWEISAEQFWDVYSGWIDRKEEKMEADLLAAGKSPSVEGWVVRRKIALIKRRRELLKKVIKWLKEVIENSQEDKTDNPEPDGQTVKETEDNGSPL